MIFFQIFIFRRAAAEMLGAEQKNLKFPAGFFEMESAKSDEDVLAGTSKRTSPIPAEKDAGNIPIP